MLHKLHALWQALRGARSLEWELPDLKRRLHALETQIAGLRGRVEIAPGLIDDFHTWRASAPVVDQPLISVCVATYNRASLLTERCLKSILAQTYSHLEVIVVGDCCTDETEQAVASLRDDRVRFVNLSERGSYPSDPQLRWMVAGTTPINHALEMATGDYITHLDDDDEFLPDRLAVLLRFARDENSDFVWHPFWWEQQPDEWSLNNAEAFECGKITTSSVFYRNWFKRVTWDPRAYDFREPGDWNRFRKLPMFTDRIHRYPHPLLRHYKERNQKSAPAKVGSPALAEAAR